MWGSIIVGWMGWNAIVEWNWRANGGSNSGGW